MSPPIPPDQIAEMRRIRSEGMALKCIAGRVGVSVKTVEKYTAGLEDARLAERGNIIAALWDSPISTADIGRRFRVTGAAISAHAKRLGLPPRKNYNPSSRKD